MPLRKSRKIKKNRRGKGDGKHTESPIAPAATSAATIYAASDGVDVEEDLCVVEVPHSASDPASVSDSSFIEMSAADKLKSQSNHKRILGSGASPIASNVTAAGIGVTTGAAVVGKANKKRRTRRGSGTSSEEERWLDAIESGKLEQVDDELKKIKDPKLMTARQRAMYERSIEKETAPCGADSLMALPTGYKEKVMTAEAIEKAQLKSQKRKQLADEKREKDKRKTMDRLLKKQESKVTKMPKNKLVKVTVPVISYYDSIANDSYVAYPLNVEFPIQAQSMRQPPQIILCAICNHNRKRYTCTKTNVPLCSFKCYKSNLKRTRITR